MTDLKPLTYIDTPEALEAWVASLDGVNPIAIDTESDSFHHYKEKVCLIQMTAHGDDVLIDPLALDTLEPLRPMLADPERIKIFHDAGYDLSCLARDFDFKIRGLFDTMLASRLLGHTSFGLAPVLRERFGFEANKRMQRSDWARRPLTDEQMHYARFDTHYLPALMAQLTDELEKVDRLKWALEDFERNTKHVLVAASRDPNEDPEAFWRVKGVKGLSPIARGRVKALYSIRETIACDLDRPPFKVFSDSILLDLATRPPKTLKQLGPRRGLRRSGIEMFGAKIVEAVTKAEPVGGSAPAGTGRRRRSGRFLDPAARKRYEALRALRKEKAASLGVEPEVTVANATLESIARDPPKNRKELLRETQLQGWREPVFIESILEALQQLSSSAKT